MKVYAESGGGGGSSASSAAIERFYGGRQGD